MAADVMTNGRHTRRRGEPAWEVARIFPVQGDWTEEEYLDLEQNRGNRMMELDDGVLEVLPMPNLIHQRIVRHVSRRMDDHATSTEMGEVFTAPSPVRMWEKQMREPDIFLVKRHRIKNPRKPPNGADLTVEVMSPGKKNRRRDLTAKRRIYAKAKVGEYWIIDPEKETVTVLTLSGRVYKVHGVFKRGDHATSKLLAGFSVDVSALFDEALGTKS